MMNNRKSLLFVLPLIALVLMACRVGNVTINNEQVEGSGNVITEEREVSGFNQVTLTSIGDLTIIQGEEEALTIEADDNIMPYIESDVRGDELFIGLENGISVTNYSPIRYTLMVKDLNRISVSGSGNVESEELNVSDLSLSISGSGNMNIDLLTANELKVNVSGSGDFDLAGTVERQDLDISGSGNYRAGDLESSVTDVQVSGSGNVTLWVVDELTIEVSGNGNVEYYGQPQVDQNISGSGSVESLGEK